MFLLFFDALRFFLYSLTFKISPILFCFPPTVMYLLSSLFFVIVFCHRFWTGACSLYLNSFGHLCSWYSLSFYFFLISAPDFLSSCFFRRLSLFPFPHYVFVVTSLFS
jgi:hypothetical protein